MKWSDLIAKALKKLGGEGRLMNICEKVFSFEESKEKMAQSTSRSRDFNHMIRAVLHDDNRFALGEKRGMWKFAVPHTPPKRYSLPARYTDRSRNILVLMRDNPVKTSEGWSQRELSKSLNVDINAINRIVNFLVMEDILYLKGGEGKSYKPFVYAPRPDVYKILRSGGMVPRRERSWI